jgi:hypothetical protein
MKRFNSKSIAIFILLSILASCNSPEKVKKESRIESDTVRMMKILLDSAFYRSNLPDYSELRENSPFGDSIIVVKEINRCDTEVSKYFGTDLQNSKLKFLLRKEICSLATKFNHDSTYFPNFIEVINFLKTDTGYEVYLRNDCVIPQFDKFGRRRDKKTGDKRGDSLSCIFGLLCGGGISMSFTKRGDTIVSRIDGRWSD